MTPVSDPQHKSLLAKIKEKKRWAIKRYGKKLLYRLAKFMESQSLVETTPIVPHEQFEFLNPLIENWQVIEKEAHEVLKFRDAIPGFQEVSRDQHRIATENNWRTLFLFGFGQKLAKNAAVAPETTKLLEAIPNMQTALFSILAPGYHIPAHTGVTKGVLRVHLGLIIPKDYKQCRIRVGDQITPWQPGGLFIIDDTYSHEVWNDTDEERVVLLVDFDRPMKWPGRMANQLSIAAMKLTAFYQEPRKNMASLEDRFEAATKRASTNLEKMSDL